MAPPACVRRHPTRPLLFAFHAPSTSVSWPHKGAPPKAPVAPPAYVRHHPPQPLLPSFHPRGTAFRGPIGSSSE
eukprot:6807766-Pyramimonas_sp.AAC.1